MELLESRASLSGPFMIYYNIFRYRLSSSMKISENIQVNSTTYNGGLFFLMFEMEQIKSVESHQG